jgi:hypothetical protein
MSFSNVGIVPLNEIMKVSSHTYSAVTVGTHLVPRNVGNQGCFRNPTLATTAVSTVMVLIVRCHHLLKGRYTDVADPVPGFSVMLIARLFLTACDSN